MPWQPEDTTVVLYMTTFVLLLIFGGVIGWVLRGWHEEELEKEKK